MIIFWFQLFYLFVFLPITSFVSRFCDLEIYVGSVKESELVSFDQESGGHSGNT